MVKSPAGPVAVVDDDPDGLLEIGCKALDVKFYKVSFNENGNVRCKLITSELKEAA